VGRALRIAFLGLPLAALLLGDDGHDVVWAGICRPRAAGARRLARRLGSANVAVVPDLARAADVVRAREPDLVVSWFWTRKVPRAFRAAARLGAVGVHPSLLPRHRGPDPYFWAIDAGDTVTGVSAHVLEDEYDTGAILGQERLAIDPSWNAWTLAKRLDRPSLGLLRRTVGAYARGEVLPRTAQDEALASAAPQPSDDELELRWSWPAARIDRRVRAASPWPGAFTEIGPAVVTLTRVRPTDDFPRALEPGEAYVRRDGVAVVRAADRAVELLRGRLDGDAEERELDARELGALAALAAQAGR
jgi:methionyl-tRNA formyltransferase